MLRWIWKYAWSKIKSILYYMYIVHYQLFFLLIFCFKVFILKVFVLNFLVHLSFYITSSTLLSQNLNLMIIKVSVKIILTNLSNCTWQQPLNIITSSTFNIFFRISLNTALYIAVSEYLTLIPGRLTLSTVFKTPGANASAYLLTWLIATCLHWVSCTSDHGNQSIRLWPRLFLGMLVVRYCKGVIPLTRLSHLLFCDLSSGIRIKPVV